MALREFTDLAEFGAHLVVRELATVDALHHGLVKITDLMVHDAKRQIGAYQPEVGPFPEWSELADSTEAEKARLGYPADAPLLREGALRESIQKEVSGLEAVVGSQSDIAAYQEFGTERIPPRPFIGPAAFRNKELVTELAAAATIAGITGGDPIHSSLGYDLTPLANI